ncbi:hypothetical protein ACWC0C_40235 [Streptomyces sp. NPDC001709]
MMLEDSRRGRGSRPSTAAALVVLSWLLTACAGSAGGSEADPAPSRASAAPPTGTSSASPGCVAGSTTLAHGPRDASVHHLCVRSGTTVTVILKPREQGRWPLPRSSNPMLALVTSSATDSEGVTRVTVRAARTGAVTVTWGPQSAPLFTLRLSVAAYPVQ